MVVITMVKIFYHGKIKKLNHFLEISISTKKQSKIKQIKQKMNHLNETILDRFLVKSKIDRKKYQLDGIRWCLNRELTLPTNKLPIRGGFVCDEMGLGKTIMMIATIVANFIPRTLVVVPNALLDQWRKEILRTTGHKAIIFHGTTKKMINMDIMNKSIIVLTTYGAVAAGGILNEVKWSRVIFDEAHNLRNGNKTRRYLSCCQLDAKIRWLMTGTPIQNKRADFIWLCRLLRMPEWMFKHDFQYITQNFVLKRTKKEVGLLLKDVEHTEVNILWKQQEERDIHTQIHGSFVGKRSDSILRTIIRSRQMCILPTMLKDKLSLMVDNGEVELKDPIVSGNNMGTSKMDILVDMILGQRSNGGDEIGKLIFCHFRTEMDVLMERLINAGVTKICIYDGRVKSKDRENILKDKYEILILQIQTCCEGLNLQENYSQIYFVAPNWNPSIEEQAIARCHRYGQSKQVQVFRFYMEESMDKYILFIQNSKRYVINDAFKYDDID